MNRIIVLLIILFLGTVVFAQDSSSDDTSDDIIDAKTVTESTIGLKIFPQNAFVWINGSPAKAVKKDAPVQYFSVSHSDPVIRVSFFAEGYWSKYVDIDLSKNISVLLEEKLERVDSRMVLLAEVKTGGAPKSVEHIPGSTQLQAALLAGTGVDRVDLPELASHYPEHPDFSLQTDYNLFFKTPEYNSTVVSPVFPAESGKQKGFVESAFTEKYTFVTQMNTAQMHVLDRKTGEYKGVVQLSGTLCKVICISSDEKRAYVSNWVTQDISVVSIEGEVADFKEIKRIPMPGIPRGMVFDESGKFLYVALFNRAMLVKVDVQDYKIVKKIGSGYGAMRHLVRHGNKLYASDMYHGHVLCYDLSSDTLIKKLYIGPKLNTIALDSRGEHLFISSRGENNPKSYYIKGPEFGKIYVVRTSDFKLIDWIWGRNQPTGLCISQDDNYLAFTDFLDNNMEIYDITAFRK